MFAVVVCKRTPRGNYDLAPYLHPAKVLVPWLL